MVTRAALGLLVVLLSGEAAAARQVDWRTAGGDLFGRNIPVEAPAPPVAEAAVAELPHREALDEAARRHEIDVRLLHALVLIESGFRAEAVSPAGAVGLTQLMPATARELGVRDRLDPRQNLEGGAAYLAAQIRKFRDIRLALAAFNAGPGRVERAGGVPRIPETEQYVAAVLECFLAGVAGREVRARRDCTPGGGPS